MVRDMKDYEKWFENNGINDPEQQEIVLDYMRELFEIATDVVLKGENKQPDLE